MISSPAWQAARNGMPGDPTATDQAAQVNQFLTSHGVTPLYQGTQQLLSTGTGFSWLGQGSQGWLPQYDVDQPFAMPAGVTSIGRVEVACTLVGAGADLQVTLYPDNGSGAPNLSSPLASGTVPASHIAATNPNGGPLATGNSSWLLLQDQVEVPWPTPTSGGTLGAVYPAGAVSGNWLLMAGGEIIEAQTDPAVATVIGAQWLGGSTLSPAVPMPALPQGAANGAFFATADTVVYAGGDTGAAAPPVNYSNVWAATWDPSTGSMGAWSGQQALPVALADPGWCSWGENLYFVGGTDSNGTDYNTVLWAVVVNGQITAWNQGPQLPTTIAEPAAAAVNGWLIVTGGQSPVGNVLESLASTWYSRINDDGSLAGWQAGPGLPHAPGVTPSAGEGQPPLIVDNGIVISGQAGLAGLTVTPDGPAAEWSNMSGAGSNYPAAAFPSGVNQWQTFYTSETFYGAAAMLQAQVVSVPLPVSGLTPGATYHLVFRQSPGPAQPNLLLPGNQTFTTAGGIGNWAPDGNASAIALSTAQEHNGNPSLEWTVGSAGASFVFCGQIIPVTAGQAYTVSAWLYLPARQASFIEMAWLNADGYLPVDLAGPSSENSGSAAGWVYTAWTGVAPEGATGAQMLAVPANPTAGQVVYANTFSFTLASFSDYLQLGQQDQGVQYGASGNTLISPSWQSSPAGSGGPWQAGPTNPDLILPGSAVSLVVYDQTPSGPLRHLVEDGGARVTTLITGGGTGQLLGVMESTALPAGSPAPAEVASVAVIGYDPASGLPVTVTQLA